MIRKQHARESSSRADGGLTVLASQPRGRSPAPRFSTWLPLIAKLAAALVGGVALAIIGAHAGVHAPEPAAPIGIAAMTSPLTLAPALAAASAAPPSVAGRTVLSEAPTSAPGDTSAVTRASDGGPESSSGILPDGRIVLNVASEEELNRLPGIGPSRAHAIVALRQRLAKFRAVEDLLRVKGIGRKTLRRIKPNVVLDRPPDADAAGPVAGM